MTGVPVGRPATAPTPEFDVFTPIRRPEQDGSAAPDAAYPQSYPDFSGPAADPYASPYGNAQEAAAYQEGSSAYREGSSAYRDSGTHGGNGTYGESGTYGSDAAFGNNADSSGSYVSEEPAGAGDGPDDFKGLPRRVRQANLAPQLRASAAAASSQGPTAVPQATAASLTDMRNTLSAMQRGWQQGRSQTQRDTED